MSQLLERVDPLQRVRGRDPSARSVIGRSLARWRTAASASSATSSIARNARRRRSSVFARRPRRLVPRCRPRRSGTRAARRTPARARRPSPRSTGHGGVRAGPLSPRKALVRDVAREDVLEDELLLAGDRGAEPREHELAVLQPVERVVAAGPGRRSAGDRRARARTPGRRPRRAGARASRPGRAGRSEPRARPAPCPGSATSSMPEAARQRSPVAHDAPSSIRWRTISSRKNGLPSARSRIRSCTDAGQVVDREQEAHQPVGLLRGERVERRSTRRCAVRRPSRGGAR